MSFLAMRKTDQRRVVSVAQFVYHLPSHTYDLYPYLCIETLGSRPGFSGSLEWSFLMMHKRRPIFQPDSVSTLPLQIPGLHGSKSNTVFVYSVNPPHSLPLVKGGSTVSLLPLRSAHPPIFLPSHIIDNNLSTAACTFPLVATNALTLASLS
jgi:hypothetical protein